MYGNAKSVTTVHGLPYCWCASASKHTTVLSWYVYKKKTWNYFLLVFLCAVIMLCSLTCHREQHAFITTVRTPVKTTSSIMKVRGCHQHTKREQESYAKGGCAVVKQDLHATLAVFHFESCTLGGSHMSGYLILEK